MANPVAFNAERYAELKADYAELRGERDSLTAELTRLHPQGFTGNGVPGDFEGLEMAWADADFELAMWLDSDDGQEFKQLRSIERAEAAS